MFKGIVYTDEIGASPAAVSLSSGVLYINPKVFSKYPSAWKYFILLHELGHYKLQTRSELKADAFAFHHFVKKGNSLKDAVQSLSKVLDTNIPEHRERIEQQLQKALWWDEVIYEKEFKTPEQRIKAIMNYIKEQEQQIVYCLGHKDVEGAKDHMVNILITIDPSKLDAKEEKFANMLAHHDLASYAGLQSSDYVFGFCFGNQRCLDRKAARQKRRHELKMKREERKRITASSKADKRIAQGNTLEILANQGIDSRANRGVGKMVSNVASAAATVFGKSGGGLDTVLDQQPTVTKHGGMLLPNPQPNPKPKPKEKNRNIAIYVGSGIALLIVIAVSIYFLSKK